MTSLMPKQVWPITSTEATVTDMFTSQSQSNSTKANFSVNVTDRWQHTTDGIPDASTEDTLVPFPTEPWLYMSTKDSPAWNMPGDIMLGSSIYLSVNVLVSVVTNVMLIVIIYNSPSLNTPPNSHLLNICINNLLLSVCMVLSAFSVNIRGNSDVITVLTSVQLFVVTNSLFQYWSTFASISYYRHRTIREQSLTLRVRRWIIKRTLSISWLASVVISLVMCLTFMGEDRYACISLNPFRESFLVCDGVFRVTAVQTSVMLVIVVAFTVGLILILSSYYSICKTLNLTGTVGKNRVTPWSRHIDSISSECTDLDLRSCRMYQPEDSTNVHPIAISSNTTIQETFVVHYQKSDHTLAFEDIFALENPILAATLHSSRTQKRQLRMTLSTASTSSTRSTCPDFTDISPGADLQRFQTLKNSSVLHKQSWRRDRVSLSSATKNSMVMLGGYLLCSLPLFVCSIPNVLSTINASDRILVLTLCRHLFYLNAPIYPIWYLFFSKRVRKCMIRVYDNTLIRLRLRR